MERVRDFKEEELGIFFPKKFKYNQSNIINVKKD